MQPSAIRAMTKLAAGAGPDLITLAGGMPNPSTFPLKQLARIAEEEIRDHHGRSLQYGLTTGLRSLVEWICKYVDNNHIHVSPSQVMCTTGSQQALDLITEVLIDTEDYIFVENPTYIGALGVFRKSGANVRSVAQDDAGMSPEDLETQMRSTPAGRTKLVYLVSNFQNPSGVSLIRERRIKIAEIIAKYEAYVIEDDPYGEIYFSKTAPPEPLSHWIPERSFYLGTFSKLVAPTFRTGWICANETLILKLELAKEAADLCSSLLDQRILLNFVSSVEFKNHLQFLREFYQQRCNAMLEGLSEFMPSGITWTHPTGGFFVWLKLPDQVDTESFLEEAIRGEKVAYIIGRPFSFDNSTRNYLRLAFSVEDPDRIKEGVRRLGKVIRRNLSS